MNLLTGATGLLGSHIAEQLRLGHQPVRCVVRPETLQQNGSAVQFLREIGCELVPGELTDQDSLTQAAQGCQVVYHTAARVGDWGPWSQFQEYTINGTRRMIEACKKNGVARLLHISSISTYGHRNGKGQVFDETTPLGFGLHKWAYYSRAKVLADQLLLRELEENNFPVTIVRPSWIYGERDRSSVGRMIRAMRSGTAKIIGDGTNRLNLCYAGNIARCAIQAANDSDSIGQAYNAADDGFITLNDFWAKVAQFAGVNPPTKHVPYWLAYRAGFVMECWGRMVGSKTAPLVTRYSAWLMGRQCFFSSEKARQRLGWKTAIGYDEGLKRSVDWWLKNLDGKAVEEGK